MTRTTWTDDEQNKLRELWPSELTMAQIGSRLQGRSAANICAKAKAIGLEKRGFRKRPKPGPILKMYVVHSFDIENAEHRRERLAKTTVRTEAGVTIYECPTAHAEGYRSELKW